MPIYGQQSTIVDTPRHPSLSWANWKNGKFMAWDKNAKNPETPDKDGAEVEITLPESLIVIAEGWSVKGYLGDKGGVWSNEVYSFAKEPLTIRNNAGEILYEGFWKDIKDKVKSVGLKLTKNVHYVDPEKPEELRTFCIKGAGLKAWLEVFADDNRFAASNHLICFKEVKDGKTGSIKYTYPVFNICDELTQEQKNLQQSWGAKLIAYQESVNITADEIKNENAVREIEDDTELPF